MSQSNQFSITITNPASAPSWLSSMPVGTWYQIAGASPDLGLSATNLASAFNDDGTGKPYTGTTGFNSLWDAWNGAAFSPSVGDRGSLLLWGGGHSDFYGNGMLRFDMETRQFSMYTNHSIAGPFTSGSALTNGGYTDNTPSPPHTYQFSHYHPETDSFVCLKSITNIDAPVFGTASVPRAWMLNLQTKIWRYGSTAAGISASSDSSSCYDSTRGVLWMIDHTTGDLGKYEPSASGDGGGTWTVYPISGTYNGGNTLGYDSATDKLLLIDNSLTRYRWFDPSNPTVANTVTMSGAPTLATKSPIEWNSVLGGFVYHKSGTGELYLITTADGWTNGSWQSLSVATNGKDFSVNNGIYSRSRTLVYGSIAAQVCSCKESSGIYVVRLT